MAGTQALPGSTSTPRAQGRGLAFSAAYLGWVLDGYETYALVLIGSQLIAELIGPGASPLYFSGLLAAQLVAWAIGGLLAGVLTDYFGRKRVLMYSVLVYGLFTGLSALATDYWVFLGLRIITGLGMGAEWGPGSALVSEIWPNRSRGKGIALLQSGFGVGFLLATGTFWLLSGTGDDQWRWMLVVGALPALLALFIRRYVKESDQWERTDRRRRRARQRASAGEQLDAADTSLTRFTVASIVTDRTLRRRTAGLLVMSAASLVGWWAVSTWIPRFVGEATAAEGAAESAITWIVLGYNFAGVLGWLAFGALADRIGRRWTIWGYYVFALAAVWLLFAVPYGTIGMLAAFVFVNGFFTLGQMGWMATYPMELFPTHVRGTAITIVFNSTRFLAAAGALLSGYLVGAFGGIQVAALTIGSIYLLGVVVTFLVGPETKGISLPD
ncbi:MFS transporter [Prauserella cavernicola]|uniref:MFS transporter n=1 Tax=Prauserella cavernicola TaxID=2800127 RepID=A0A934QY90_9PSEU|nr:MFS transporter [Prauserella cavernicola]MBK1787478.1 MFS transporter [Prauserella cavernicola]